MPEFPEVLAHGSGLTMTLDPTRLLVSTRKPMETSAITAAANSRDLVLESDASPVSATRRGDTAPDGEIVNHTDTRYWVLNQAGAPVSDAQVDALTGDLGNNLEWVGPVYQIPNVPGRGGLVCPLPNVLLVGGGRRLDPRGERSLRKAITDAGLTEVEEKSKYLPGYRYYEVKDPSKATAYEIRDALLAAGGRGLDIRLETMPLVIPTTVSPNDTLFGSQWNMTQVRAGGAGATGWDIETGLSSVVVAILDQGIDRAHPDLSCTAAGINLGTMSGNGSPTGNHGTPCAGIAAAIVNNNAGVAGVAGGCQLMPIAFQNWTDAEVAAGITYAAANGASVISMSFGHYGPGEGMAPAGWDFAIIDPAITAAVDTDGLVLCAATGNENLGTFNRYPARNPRVVAVGASDQADNRKNPGSPDGEPWGSNFGPGMDVMAPGVLIPTTDRLGAAGYVAGDYRMNFNGTSAATPHVAGFAALLLSEYPAITNQQVRDIIERTAPKAGAAAYLDNPAMPNGVSNAQMGYGRINVYQGLDFADISINDWWGDTGSEPSSPPGGNFWTYSDIVVRINDDGIFQPDDPGKSSNIERGQTNYLYVRVTNRGPAAARNVVVGSRIVAYVGTEFVYPFDWTATNAQHIAPTAITASFANIPAGGTAIAKFSISSTQVESVWGWVSGNNWHPCIVASATADNDYAFASASTAGSGLITRRNNLAQRNVSVIDVLASATVLFPFVIGSKAEFGHQLLELQIDRGLIPRDVIVELLIDENLEHVLPTIVPDIRREAFQFDELRIDTESFRFLDPVRVEMRSGAGRGLLMMEAGSRLATTNSTSTERLHVIGGEELVRDDHRFVRIEDAIGIVKFERDHSQQKAVALQLTIPASAKAGETYPLTVSQKDPNGNISGGATVIYRVREG